MDGLSLAYVSTTAHMPLKRMILERGMVQMMLKMPVFCLCVICLLIAPCQLSPPESTFNVHRRIMTHFSLHTVSSTRSFDVVYNLIDAFQKQNSLPQATSTQYWSVLRYAELVWDVNLRAPLW
jgi:hypothetical protein